MIYELRIYHMNPGKMDAIIRRFSNHTLRIFEGHGIKVTDFYLDAEGNDRLYYLCEYDSVEAKEKAWKAFVNDPEWIKVAAESEKDGEIVMKIDSHVMDKAPFFVK